MEDRAVIVVRDPKKVCDILRDRKWVKRGRIWEALHPLLGDGLILAEGQSHLEQREQIGPALRRIPQHVIDDAADDFELPPVGAREDVAVLMMRMVEHVVKRVLFGGAGEEVGPAIRGWLSLVPLQLLGVPAGFLYLRKLDRAIAKLPPLPWMPPSLTARQKRDQIATIYVAAVETTAASLTWELASRPTGPIWFLPRQNISTGETAICILPSSAKFGVGHRQCLGALLAGQISSAIKRRMTEQSRWLPYRFDLRPRLSLTRWPRMVVMDRVV